MNVSVRMADNLSWQLSRTVLSLRPSARLRLEGEAQQAVAKVEAQLMPWARMSPGVAVEEIAHYKEELLSALLAHSDAVPEDAKPLVDVWWKALITQALHAKQAASGRAS